MTPLSLTLDDHEPSKSRDHRIVKFSSQIFKVKITYGEGQPNKLKMVPNESPDFEVS